MLRLFLFVGLGVLAVLGAPNAYTSEIEITTNEDEITQINRKGDINDGHWECPWTLSGFECSNGKFTCMCPGDGKKAWFYIGCSYVFPKCGVIHHKNTNCGKYANCASCRSGIGEWNKQVCSACQPGFALGVGDCKTDINECDSMNGGCAQGCVNTYGSYYCTCQDGYRLMEDGQDCDRLSCDFPGDLNAGSVAPSAAWVYDSYAKFTCNDPTLSVVGYSSRKCVGQGPQVWWDGQQPQCRDTCAAVADDAKMKCGSTSISRDKCVQLGCCYNHVQGSEVPSCYHNPALTFVKFAGERPTVNSGNGFFTQERSTREGCAFQCLHDNPESCHSFGIRNDGGDEEHGVTFQKCHLQEESRNFYDQKKQLRNDPKYDMFEPLVIGHSITSFSAVDQPLELHDKLYVGCFADDEEHRDLSHYQFSSGADMTIEKCQTGCRQQGFSYAGLQNGMDCYCSNALARIHGPSDSCTVSCTGDRDQMCGGELSNSVYHVPYDTRYRGCYEDAEDLDLPMTLWKNDAGRSAESCIEECAIKGFKYAGVQNGGACACGDSYGRHGPANETDCHVRCEGWGHQNCGGQTQNAVYVTEIPFDLSTGIINPEATKAYDSTGKIAGVSTRLFTYAPHLRSIVTKKLVIYSENEVQTPYDDLSCQDNCYTPCGEISQVDQLSNVGDELTLRFFFLRFSDIKKYTGSTAKKVFVYAETVLIDASVSVDFSLLIKTRQLIIDRSYATTIDVHGRAPDLGIDVDEMKANGPEPELLQRKMAFTCARILLDTRERQHIYTAWGIIQAISKNMGQQAEVEAYSATVRNYGAFLYGMDRENIHFVPYYTKSHISALLGNYYERISLYKNNMDRLEDKIDNQDEFLKVAEGMQKIYTDTAISEAEQEYESSQTALTQSNTTYHRYKEHFSYSRTQLEESRKLFEKGLKEGLAWRIVKAVFSFAGAVAKVVVGGIDFDKDNLKESTDGIVDDSQALVDTMSYLSYGIQQIESLDKMTENIFFTLEHIDDVNESVRYADDLELMVSMATTEVHWENLKNYAKVMLTDRAITGIPGAREYKVNLLSTANWGIAMTKSMIEKAELIRYSMDCKFKLNSKKKQQDRIQKVFNKAYAGLDAQEEIMRNIYEQTYDVRADLNDALLMFCQSYFYENLYECKEAYKPSFGGDLNDLLLKINAARRDELLIPGSAPSTASRILTIKDENTDPDCEDASVCPVNYFRKNRIFLYTLPIDQPQLKDLDKYMVSEIILDFKDAKALDENTFLKLRIESSGNFLSKSQGQVYNFLTQPLKMAFEYDVNNGHVSLRADVYKPYRNIVNHITPYSTWVMTVAEERSSDIDVSAVSSITLRLDGSAIDSHSYQAMAAEVSPETNDRIPFEGIVH